MTVVTVPVVPWNQQHHIWLLILKLTCNTHPGYQRLGMAKLVTYLPNLNICWCSLSLSKTSTQYTINKVYNLSLKIDGCIHKHIFYRDPHSMNRISSSANWKNTAKHINIIARSQVANKIMSKRGTYCPSVNDWFWQTRVPKYKQAPATRQPDINCDWRPRYTQSPPLLPSVPLPSYPPTLCYYPLCKPNGLCRRGVPKPTPTTLCHPMQNAHQIHDICSGRLNRR